MIITSLLEFARPPALTMVDGCFDPLHGGHIAYMRGAAGLGVPVFCNLASDAYITRIKRRPPFLGSAHRLAVVDALRYVDFVFVAEEGTTASLRQLRPTFYVKGADWRDRLPAEQISLCRAIGTDIVYLDCAISSSTAIVDRFLEAHRAYTRV